MIYRYVSSCSALSIIKSAQLKKNRDQNSINRPALRQTDRQTEQRGRDGQKGRERVNKTEIEGDREINNERKEEI
jgi:hypothetical protein